LRDELTIAKVGTDSQAVERKREIKLSDRESDYLLV
jgi:hypothetical protein